MYEEIVNNLQMQEYETAAALASKLTCEELAAFLCENDLKDLPVFCRALPADKLAGALTQLLTSRKFSVIKPLIASMNATDLAEVFEETENETDMLLLFRILPKDLAAETFVEMESNSKEQLISKLSDKELRAVMDELFVDDTVDLIEEMPASVVKRVLAQSDKETRAYINEILKYPKDSAGSIMTIEFVALRKNMTVAEAFERIRKTAIDKETIYTCYVTDERKSLLGLVTAKDMLLASPQALIGDIMNENVIYAHTLDDKEDVAQQISDYGFLALPIVDRELRLVGIVTVDDAMTVIEEENTEDIEKMAAVVPTDKPYLKTSAWRLCINRLPWLLILLISSTLSGLVISANDKVFSGAIYGIVLTACTPMLMGTGGNAGSQASAMIIRGLALGEVKFSDFWKVVWKEMRVSLLLGVILAGASFVKVLTIDGLYAVENGWLIALVICLSMLATIIVAKLIGATLPLLAKKCRLDPAVVASPFITTIVDVVSLSLCCLFAIWFLGII